MGQKAYPQVVLFALTKNFKSSYTMDMKTKKMSLTILFGLLFSVACGNIFAGEAFDQLKDAVGNAAPASDVKIELAPKTDITNTANLALDTKKAASPVGALKAAVAPPAPAPNRVKEFVSTYKTHILMGGVGAYLGFSIMGTLLGALTGGLFIVGLLFLAAA